MASAAVQANHAFDISARFCKRRYPLVAVHPAFAGVVGGQGVVDVAAVVGQQPAQVAHAAAQVLRGIKGVAHIEALRRVGNQLHQAHRGFGRLGLGIEVGLDRNHREHQLGVELVPGAERCGQWNDPAFVSG